MATNFFILIIMIIPLNIWLAQGLPMIDYDTGNQTAQCHHQMTLMQIVQLLKQQPCAQILEKENRHVVKRNTDGGNVDIHALQTTINDHRTMINYLINNSLNATFVADAISNHHSKTGPILSSWRDLIDVFTVLLFIGFLIYYCLCRAGCIPCDRVLSCCCMPLITRLHQQKQQQQQQQQQEKQQTTANEQNPRKKQHRRPHSSIASIDGDIVRFNHGYMSE